jgi:hypothetical protein
MAGKNTKPMETQRAEADGRDAAAPMASAPTQSKEVEIGQAQMPRGKAEAVRKRSLKKQRSRQLNIERIS